MRIAMLATASAMAFVFAIGSVSAADQFKTLKGVKAVQMTAGELSNVRGMDHHFFIILKSENNPNAVLVTVGSEAPGPTTDIAVLDPKNSANAAPLSDGTGRFNTDWRNEESNSVSITGNASVAPSYLGLRNACGNGVIGGPTFLC